MNDETASLNSMPTVEDLRAARKRIAALIHRTPVMTSALMDERVGASLFFKCENLQRTGAFKLRGAANAVLGLDEKTARAGVATHSSGNHAAALARAARHRGIRCRVVMPSGALKSKRDAVAGYGAEIIECEPTMTAREETLARLVQETGAHPVPPFDDWRIVAGQASATLELLEEVADLDAVLAPVGGGGLLAGACLAVRSLESRTAVFGAEPAAADDAARALKTGRVEPVAQPATIADGLRATLGRRPFEVIRQHARDILVVDEDEIIAAMRLVWTRMKLVIEPSSAVPVAALLRYGPPAGATRIGVILSGGNVDIDALPWA